MFKSRYIFIALIFLLTNLSYASTTNKKLVYIVSDSRIPFWDIMARGIQKSAKDLEYDLDIFSSENRQKKELESTVKAIQDKVSGIIISPTNSSACSTVLKLAKQANIPVVIADIGTDKGDYVTYISSNNYQGAYGIGKVLANKLIELKWDDGKVGIIAIPQKRINGQLRTEGFMKALEEKGIKSADLKQQITWTEEETYNYSKEMIEKYPDLRAIWLQGSDKYKGALRAINEAKKENEILLITFDAEPIFLELINKNILLGSAMQQPYLMGKEAVYAMDKYLNGKTVEKSLQLPILIVSKKNILENLITIKQNVLGIEENHTNE